MTLTFGLHEQMFQEASTSDGEQLCKTILKSIHNCRSYGPDEFGRMHTHTLNCHCDNYISLTESGLDNKKSNPLGKGDLVYLYDTS